MYGQLLVLIENRTDEIARKLVQEIQEKEELRHYRVRSPRTLEERIGNVIKDMCDRLGNWLNRESPRIPLASHYSRLGAQRFREGAPLDESVLVFLLIKRRIWDELRSRIVVDNSFTLSHLRELEENYHLFFDRMIQAVITGFLAESGHEPGNGGSGKVRAGRKVTCRSAGKGKPKASQSAKEDRP